MAKIDISPIEKEYAKIKKAHDLPAFKELDKEFELSVIEVKPFLVRAIRRRMNDKVIFFCRIIEGLLYPHEKSHIHAYESSFFNEQQKEQLTITHKKIMLLERDSLLLDIDSNEEQDARYIRDLAKDWKQFKQTTTQAVLIMKKAWETPQKEEKGGAYFG